MFCEYLAVIRIPRFVAVCFIVVALPLIIYMVFHLGAVFNVVCYISERYTFVDVECAFSRGM